MDDILQNQVPNLKILLEKDELIVGVAAHYDDLRPGCLGDIQFLLAKVVY